MDLIDRAHAALLGLACGDRFGAPLEFVTDASVRSRDFPLGHWTDDTHMSLYLGESILAYGPITAASPFDPDRFGTCVGEAFVRWLHDPLTPSTAPGLTCLAGVRHFASHRDWRTSGVVSSDGCGAVMRIVPLVLAWRGDTLLEAARVSALVTHAHPTALEAAMAGSWLIRKVLETGVWSGDFVAQAVYLLENTWGQSGKVADSLRAALVWAEKDEEWLDEGAIPPGDGGWRAGSALGLAVAAALRWPQDLGLAVEKAARIQGDSDSVACLTGAILGAALGTAAIPSAWRETLPQREKIDDLVDRLITLGNAD